MLTSEQLMSVLTVPARSPSCQRLILGVSCAFAQCSPWESHRRSWRGEQLSCTTSSFGTHNPRHLSECHGGRGGVCKQPEALRGTETSQYFQEEPQIPDLLYSVLDLCKWGWHGNESKTAVASLLFLKRMVRPKDIHLYSHPGEDV